MTPFDDGRCQKCQTLFSTGYATAPRVSVQDIRLPATASPAYLAFRRLSRTCWLFPGRPDRSVTGANVMPGQPAADVSNAPPRGIMQGTLPCLHASRDQFEFQLFSTSALDANLPPSDQQSRRCRCLSAINHSSVAKMCPRARWAKRKTG